jgi:hypothetical protein
MQDHFAQGVIERMATTRSRVRVRVQAGSSETAA